MQNEARVIAEQRGELLWVSLSNPARRNAMTQAMWRQLMAVVESAANNPSVKVLVLQGDGDQAFCAGADIAEFSAMAQDPARMQVNNALIQSAQAALHNVNKVTVALVQGACVGGGCGLALCCDFRFATADARFAITPAKLGLLYSKDDTRRALNLLGPALTRELLFTGRVLDAEEALAAGLLNGIVAKHAIADRVQALAEQIGANSQYAVRGIKQVLAALEGHGQASEAQLQRVFDDAFQGEDFREGVDAFLAKRAPDFPHR